MLRFDDFVEESRAARTVADLSRTYLKAIRSEGYENCILTTVDSRKVGQIGWYEFPDGYADAYVGKRWERIDPVLARTLRASRPFSWSDVVERTKLSPAQQLFMNECRDLKVHSGVVFPFHGPGYRVDVISISRRTSDAPDLARQAILHAASLQTLTRYREITRVPLFTERSSDVMTARELEILKWCKDGKSRDDIQKILSLSRQTVDFHLGNIFKKLGASNVTSAVVIALYKGFIEL
jgi:DNA-binding CsgD family transcriptional regulator